MVKFVIAQILAGMVLMTRLLTQTKINKGQMLFEGDILQANEKYTDKPIKALPIKGALWSDKVIPYEFHHSVNQWGQSTIRQAMNNWEEVTCITFVPQTNQRNFLRFRTDSDGCFAFIGRKETFEAQDVNLGKGCMQLRTARHEIGHSLGFSHEHSRKDRDSVIKILWDNIEEDKVSNFILENDDRSDIPYDLTSVMHYIPMAFSRKPLEKNTIVTKNPHHQRFIGSGQTISFWDAKLANKMYSCNAFCPNLFNETQQCQNGGYLSHKGNNSWCDCICPPETYGTYCENTRNEDYYSYSLSICGCGGNVTEEQEIQTPRYPYRESSNLSCSWWIQAPPRKRVMVTFLDFSFNPREDSKTSEYQGRCVDERVEIRTNSMVEGNMYCGEDIKPGSNLASKGDEFIIIITTLFAEQNTRGLKAKVSFID